MAGTDQSQVVRVTSMLVRYGDLQEAGTEGGELFEMYFVFLTLEQGDVWGWKVCGANTQIQENQNKHTEKEMKA